MLIILFVLSAQAQHTRVTPVAEQPAVWSMFIGQQLAQSLESPSAGIRAKALEQVTLLARSFGDALNLADAVPALLSIYNKDTEEQCRIAAVAALHAIGDEWGLHRMRQGIASQSSKQVQHTTLAALRDYYEPSTFEGEKDLAIIAESVLAYYEAVRLTLSFIASER